jgi:hypothetical protein
VEDKDDGLPTSLSSVTAREDGRRCHPLYGGMTLTDHREELESKAPRKLTGEIGRITRARASCDERERAVGKRRCNPTASAKGVVSRIATFPRSNLGLRLDRPAISRSVPSVHPRRVSNYFQRCFQKQEDKY